MRTEFTREGPREADHALLGRGVVRLAGGAEARAGGEQQDAAVVLLDHRLDRSADAVVCAAEVDGQDRVPLFFRHVEDHAVTKDAGDVAHDVQPSELLQSRVHQVLRVGELGDVAVVRDGLAAHRLDLVDDAVGWAGVVAGAVQVAAEVGDDNLRAFLSHLEGDATADAASSARDDRDAAFESVTHLSLLVSRYRSGLTMPLASVRGICSSSSSIVKRRLYVRI